MAPETPGNPPETPVLALRKPLGNPRCILWAEAVNVAKICTLPEAPHRAAPGRAAPRRAMPRRVAVRRAGVRRAVPHHLPVCRAAARR